MLPAGVSNELKLNYVDCEACIHVWTFTLREERRLRVFENRVLRRIFGPKRDEVTKQWRKLRNEELKDLFSSYNILRVIKSRRMRWAGHVARMEEKRGLYRVLVGKLEGKRPLGRPRCRWEDNIKMDFQEVECGVVDTRVITTRYCKYSQVLLMMGENIAQSM